MFETLTKGNEDRICYSNDIYLRGFSCRADSSVPLFSPATQSGRCDGSRPSDLSFVTRVSCASTCWSYECCPHLVFSLAADRLQLIFPETSTVAPKHSYTAHVESKLSSKAASNPHPQRPGHTFTDSKTHPRWLPHSTRTLSRSTAWPSRSSTGWPKLSPFPRCRQTTTSATRLSVYVKTPVNMHTAITRVMGRETDDMRTTDGQVPRIRAQGSRRTR